ncbi:autotransporter outer membrane beta-barrel domain-containing protein [Campylobacter upsaliensis]|uniref:autotransporter outer membrane beta-barrel domain-containing protein n=1 Tax=Campylobacter upsaliensis TaxID=28080 RepID=UPI0022EAF521|nr:autotransporter outer membrane beta-barrel domain-containing protein [Campylobacter upsaliensis]
MKNMLEAGNINVRPQGTPYQTYTMIVDQKFKSLYYYDWDNSPRKELGLEIKDGKELEKVIFFRKNTQQYFNVKVDGTLSELDIREQSGGDYEVIVGQNGKISTVKQASGVVETKWGDNHQANSSPITKYELSGGTLNNKIGITTLDASGGALNNQGTITTLNHKSGIFKLDNQGTITTLTQDAGELILSNKGTINTFTQNGGVLTNQQDNTIDKLSSKNGTLNNFGTINTFTLETQNDFNLNNIDGDIKDITIKSDKAVYINENTGIGYKDGIATIKIANGSTPTLYFKKLMTATTAQSAYSTVKFIDDTSGANNTQAKVQVDKAIIALVSRDTKIGQNVYLSNVVSGASNVQSGQLYVKDADFSEELKESGFYGTFNPQTQTIDTRFNSNLGAAGLFSQTFINQLGRRSLLFDAFLNEASRASLRYKETQPDTNFDIFVRPYISKLKTDVKGISDKADGTSYGILAGGHSYLDSGLLMLYGAVEKNKTDLADYVFNFNSDTFLVGAKYGLSLYENHIAQFFGGIDVRGSYTKANIERQAIKGFKAEGDTNNYAYDARLYLASIIHYDLQDRSKYLTPQIGIGHTGAKLKGFEMKGEKLAYTEELNDMAYDMFYATASLNWFRRWPNNIATQLDGGVRYNISNTIDTQTKINGIDFRNSAKISKYYSQLGGALMWIRPYGVDVSLSYKFLFGESATSHTASLRLHKTF